MNAKKPFSPSALPEEVLLAAPRGFCAGVDRAIKVVERSLEDSDRPVYVRHEIVHNRAVVEDLRAKGAIFVEATADIPQGALAIFSAHGVSPEVRLEALARKLTVVDATCPLVSKVHSEVMRYARAGYTVLYVGHPGHPEVMGVAGEAPDQVKVIASRDEAEQVEVPDCSRLAYATQTTLSVDDTAEIVEVLKRRFPQIMGPRAADICYATQNRQQATLAIAQQAEVVLVVGAPNSSNSNRLREVAEAAGARAYQISSADELQTEWLQGARRVGLTSGASTPERLVQEVLGRLLALGVARVREVVTTGEDMFFALPPLASEG